MSFTKAVYVTLDFVSNYFNEHVLGGELPDNYVITLQRKGDDGYFSPDKFKSRTDIAKAHEIGLNPDKFDGKSDVEILMVLVHQLCHFWEWEYCQANGLKKPARGYHSRRWANKMIRCGLMPSSTGKPKGKQTGSHVSQYVLEGGLFDWACRRLLAEGFKLYWDSKDEKLIQGSDSKKPNQKNRDKVKYTCLICSQNCWAKPNARFDCGKCRDRWGREERLVPEHSGGMQEADWDDDLKEWPLKELNKLELIPVAAPAIRGLAKSSAAPISRREARNS